MWSQSLSRLNLYNVLENCHFTKHAPPSTLAAGAADAEAVASRYGDSRWGLRCVWGGGCCWGWQRPPACGLSCCLGILGGPGHQG